MTNKNDDQISDGLLVFPGKEAFGFLRFSENNYSSSYNDIYVPPHLIKTYRLRHADRVSGHWSPPQDNQRSRSLTDVLLVNKKEPIKDPPKGTRPYFEDLVPSYPDKILRLEHPTGTFSGRVIDMMTPIGRGQRTLIVASPRCGKTILLQNVAVSIQKNHPDVILIVLLIDERPEEVTDMREIVRGEVISSTFDEPPERHVEVAEVVVERARRLAEMNGHVVILLDSITRLARAYNTIIPTSGRIMSGGLDARALQGPKKIFGAARNLRGAGSITIIGTALVDTGSKMDEVIFEEFKGTGNSEIHLDRKLAEKRVFPSIDIFKSGTRKEELLIDSSSLDKIHAVRKILNPLGPVGAMETLLEQLKKYKTNPDLLKAMK